MPVTDAELEAIVTALVSVTKEQVTEAVTSVTARLDALEQRAKALEVTQMDKPVMKDAGIWQPGTLYQPGDVVTTKGTIWCCQERHAAHEFPHNFFRMLAKSHG